MRNTVGMVMTLLASILAGVPAVAQDGPPRFLFVIESIVADTDAPVWGLAMQDVASAHQRHPDGRSWAAYQALTGGPDARFRFYMPVEKLADMDGWPSNRQVVVEALGADAGKAALRVLDATADPTDRLLAYSEELSRPPAPRPMPYRNLWILTVTVERGKLIEYASLMRRVIKAHEAHENGLHWVAYGGAIGGEPGQVELVVPYDDFAELDAWPGMLEVLGEIYGDDDAARIVEALAAVTDSVSELWTLAPSISVIPEGGRD